MIKLRQYILDYAFMAPGQPEVVSDTDIEMYTKGFKDLLVRIDQRGKSITMPFVKFIRNKKYLKALVKALLERGMIRYPELQSRTFIKDLYFKLITYFGRNKPPYDFMFKNGTVISVHPEKK